MPTYLVIFVSDGEWVRRRFTKRGEARDFYDDQTPGRRYFIRETLFDA